MCWNHPIEEHVSTYEVSRVGQNCSSVTSIEAYLIVDNAAENDAGLYEINVTAQFESPKSSVRSVNVSIGMYATYTNAFEVHDTRMLNFHIFLPRV